MVGQNYASRDPLSSSLPALYAGILEPLPQITGNIVDIPRLRRSPDELHDFWELLSPIQRSIVYLAEEFLEADHDLIVSVRSLAGNALPD